ncbi:MAG TPA: hypothetical protein PKC20_00350 [Burkholderiaceae bacterium]|nr:hypothetical protein [Burkholderiaceae bacterium]
MKTVGRRGLTIAGFGAMWTIAGIFASSIVGSIATMCELPVVPVSAKTLSESISFFTAVTERAGT